MKHVFDQYVGVRLSGKQLAAVDTLCRVTRGMSYTRSEVIRMALEFGLPQVKSLLTGKCKTIKAGVRR